MKLYPLPASAALLALLSATLPAQALDLSHLPDVSMLPKGVVQISPVVPGMGEHWADPANLPLGPIYCVYQGKIVCLEFMIAQADFAAGKSWPDLPGLEGLPPVNHVNMGFEPHGHEGDEIPHYDMHIYYLPPADMAEVK